jgi:hypothetical protein
MEKKLVDLKLIVNVIMRTKIQTGVRAKKTQLIIGITV